LGQARQGRRAWFVSLVVVTGANGEAAQYPWRQETYDHDHTGAGADEFTRLLEAEKPVIEGA
jgi:hypothetical protein